MDSDAGLYLAKRDENFGVIDINGNIKIFIEYDQIGIDITKFTNNNIRNKYILVDNLIPVKKDGLWGFFDKTGKQLVDFKYDSFGYIASGSRDAMNLLVVPDYNILVAEVDNKYALVNSSGAEVVPAILDDAYMTVSSGVTYYYMTYNDQRYNIEQYLDDRGGAISGNSNSSSNNTSNESQSSANGENAENVENTESTDNQEDTQNSET